MCKTDKPPEYLGRPVECSCLERVRELCEEIDRHGPYTGVKRLKALFPDIPQSEIAYILNHQRFLFHSGELKVTVTTWTEPGSVWAMDFTKPPVPVDGIYTSVFVVRDLSSGNTLMALPVKKAKARAVLNALKELFLMYGPPLVIKSDNGKQFKSKLVSRWLKKEFVLQLFTPVYTPEYNGAIEAGIGAIKVFTHHESARNNRPGQWTCDDLEAARLRLNATSRPRGILGPCPDELFSERRKIPKKLRRNLHVLAEKYFTRDMESRRIAGKRKNTAASLRLGIRLALEKTGLLVVKRNRITQPINSKKKTDIR